MSGFSGAGFSVCCGWGLSGCVCERGFWFIPVSDDLSLLPLSVRYAFECNFLIWGTSNQPLGVVFWLGLRAWVVL